MQRRKEVRARVHGLYLRLIRIINLAINPDSFFRRGRGGGGRSRILYFSRARVYRIIFDTLSFYVIALFFQ